jgi:hypothetical protein
MSAVPLPWRPSAVLLLISGLLIAGIGLFFLVLRPPLLPEDVRFMRLSSEQLAELGPLFRTWLDRVLAVLGGFAFATGLLAMSLAATSFRARSHLAFAGAAAAGASSIGLMSVVNAAIDSDFKWLLVGFAVVWASSLMSYLIEAQTPRSSTQSNQEHNHETP